MKTKNQQKGNKLENFVAQAIQESGLGHASRERGSGNGNRKGDIAANLPFLLECKNQKKLAFWQSIKQAQDQARLGNENPDKWALVTQDPNSPSDNPEVYVTIDLYQFLTLLKKDSQPRVKEPDRELKWKLERLKSANQDVLRLLK